MPIVQVRALTDGESRTLLKPSIADHLEHSLPAPGPDTTP